MMPTQLVASFGAWESPITAEAVSLARSSIEELEVHSESGTIYYIQRENGRSVIKEYSDHVSHEVLPDNFCARTGVHEYGGAAMACGLAGNLIFTDSHTNGVFRLNKKTRHVEVLIAADDRMRYADFAPHPLSSRWVLAIREAHLETVQNDIVAIDCVRNICYAIASGRDFYSHPRFSPDGERVCFLAWDLSDMPWTGASLCVGNWVADGVLTDVQVIAGESQTVSISQPRWGIDGSLFYASDISGFYQLHRSDGISQGAPIKLEGLEDVEFSRPEWVLGCCTYIPLTPNKIVACYSRNATDFLITIDLEHGTHALLETPLVSLADKGLARISDTCFLALGTQTAKPLALYLIDVSYGTRIDPLQTTSLKIDVPESLYSTAQHISVPRTRGLNREGMTHTFFYQPKNPAYIGDVNSSPPLILSLHGGPTAHSSPALNLKVQYWTSRGYAVAEVNYAGSSGYGRHYRTLLDGNWGNQEVDDAASCVSYLMEKAWVDKSRVGIVGKSAGGYTVLRALSCHPDLWAGGISIAGISDLGNLSHGMHKFESVYLKKLLSNRTNTPMSDMEALVRQRSPCFNAGWITAPILLLHGTEDRVVSKNQSEIMRDAIREAGGSAKLVLFEKEGHSFRSLANLQSAKLEEEQWWVTHLSGT